MAETHADVVGTSSRVLVVLVDSADAEQSGVLLALSKTLPGARLVAVGPDWDDAASALTGRECQVAGLLMKGMSNKEIAVQLCIEVATVKNHVHSILGKLHVRRRGEVVARLAFGPG